MHAWCPNSISDHCQTTERSYVIEILESVNCSKLSMLRIAQDLYEIISGLLEIVRSLHNDLPTGSKHAVGACLKHSRLPRSRLSCRGLANQREGDLALRPNYAHKCHTQKLDTQENVWGCYTFRYRKASIGVCAQTFGRSVSRTYVNQSTKLELKFAFVLFTYFFSHSYKSCYKLCKAAVGYQRDNTKLISLSSKNASSYIRVIAVILLMYLYLKFSI